MIPAKQMTFLSLFAGIPMGGLDLGLERAGMRCIGQVEIDPFCRKVLAKHWPNVPKFDDVRTFNAGMLNEKPDLICGGFPCQDISVAGNMAGIDGERSGLWTEFLRLIRDLRPRFAIIENVAALLVRGIDRVLCGLAEVGFNAEWTILSACQFGAPHTRERLFIVAYRDEIGRIITRERVDGKHEISPGLYAWQAAPTRPEWRYVQRWACEAVENGNGIIAAAERGGMADGLPNRLDRIGSLGNAVVPQVAEFIGRAILSALSAGEGKP